MTINDFLPKSSLSGISGYVTNRSSIGLSYVQIRTRRQKLTPGDGRGTGDGRAVRRRPPPTPRRGRHGRRVPGPDSAREPGRPRPQAYCPARRPGASGPGPGPVRSESRLGSGPGSRVIVTTEVASEPEAVSVTSPTRHGCLLFLSDSASSGLPQPARYYCQ